MKKTTCIHFLLMLVLILAACNANDNGRDGNNQKVKGVKNVDVVNSHGSIAGLERMQSFYNNMQNDVSSDLRVVHYTIEGDPIVTDLTYNGESLVVKDDNTRDKFGSGEIRTNSCSDLVEEINPTNTSYIAVGCESGPAGMEGILEISYNMGQQDLFEFELTYGQELENEINTKTNTFKKVISDVETNVKSDFVLAERVRQEVYKKLVFANYLAEKDLEVTCDSEEAMNYFLKVYINGGQREYSWSACDQSNDGVKFTQIAEYIIQQSEQEPSEEPEVMVQGYVLEVKEDTLLIGEDLTRLEYEWLKDEIQQNDLTAYIFDFTILEGVHTGEFNPGDKIQAIIEGSISGSKPGKAKVKKIKNIP